MLTNQILHGDSYEILPTLPDKSFDTVIIDPPYGMGMDKAWDKVIDVRFISEQIARIGKEFYAVFGQMPYLSQWHNEAEKAGLKFCEHIAWVKRAASPYGNRLGLQRTHEDIFIYRLTDSAHFYTIKGKYEDIKVPGVLFDIMSIEGIKRYISALWQEVETGQPTVKKKSNSGHKTHRDKYRIRYDTFRASREVNFMNVWSFLPESKRTFGRNDKIHPTMKPLLLQERLVEMLTPEHGSVLDCFSGSGTTAIACKRLNRQFLCIEKERDYYEHSLERLRGDVYQPDLNFYESC